MSNPTHYLWLDLETTGLDPSQCDIWEVAVILTDKDYVEIKRAHTYVLPPYSTPDWCPSFPIDLLDSYLEDIRLGTFTEFAYKMHVESGLLNLWEEAVRNELALSIESCEGFLEDFVADVPDELVTLAGSSVHYDHNFIAANFPLFNKRLHHRHHDLSAVKIFINNLSPNASNKFRNDVTPKHIAMNDLDSDLNWARAFKDHLISKFVFSTLEKA